MRASEPVLRLVRSTPARGCRDIRTLRTEHVAACVKVLSHSTLQRASVKQALSARKAASASRSRCTTLLEGYLDAYLAAAGHRRAQRHGAVPHRAARPAPATQLRQLREYAVRRGFEVAVEFVDFASGTP